MLTEYDKDAVMAKMMQVLKIEKNIILDKRRGNPCRPLAIYLIKRFTPHSLSEIGNSFKMDYSAVSQAAKKFELKIEMNSETKEIMQRMLTALMEG